MKWLYSPRPPVQLAEASMRRSTIRTQLFGAALALSLIGGACALHPSHPPLPPNPLVTDEQRNLAMLSIHAHAFWPDRNFSGVSFLPLDRAIAILDEDTGPAADSHVRRAIANLWAYGYGRQDF
jgi:hypothetical protein